MPDENQPPDSRMDVPDDSANTKPVAVIDGRPYTPVTTVSTGLGAQKPRPGPSKWRLFFIVLGVMQALGVALFFLIMASAAQQAKAGASGTEFIALLLFVTLIPAIGVVGLINLVGLPLYMKKHRPKGKGLILSVLSLVISLILASYGAYTAFQVFVALPARMAQSSEELRIRAEANRQEFAAANANPEITKEEAVALLRTCKLKGFYYTNQTDKSDPANGGWGELSSTGVVLTKVRGQPYRISIADKLIPELVPIAREAQKTCAGLQFWHDGGYEQFKDGNWYFKGTVVNNGVSGAAPTPAMTKEEAIRMMQACKVDYFVGYTSDVNTIFDQNTKAWLQKAEQATTGIAISESAPKTYVFASKTMTADLQDEARGFRQTCYNTKKLYITIDDWIETEYATGTWTRVKR